MAKTRSRIDGMKKVLAEGYYSTKVEGSRIDAFSAGAYVAVYNALSEDNRARLEALPLMNAMKVVWKLIGKEAA